MININNNIPLFSIIIPVYNVEAYLKQCVDSVINQTYKNIEIILVDDGSPDNSPKICDKYAAYDNRIKVIHKENGGLSDARNEGIKKAQGDYLIFVDSDDKLASDKIFSELVEFITEKNSDIIYCSSVTRFNNDTNNYSFEKTNISFGKQTPDTLFNLASRNHYIFAAWLFIVRREIIIDNNIFFIKGLLHEDMEWIPRLLCSQKDLTIDIFTKPFYLYRFNPNSITGTFSQKRFDSLIKIISDLSKWIIKEPKNLFLKKWFNMNLYTLILFLEKDCILNSNFYKLNKSCLFDTLKNNYRLLNSRNKIIFIIMKVNLKILFILRKKIKGMKR